MILAASTATAIATVIFALTVVIAGGFLFANWRQGRREVGSEIELAPNRKPYYSDEEMEGPRLDLVLTFGLILVVISAIAVPLYYLNEPGRQEGEIGRFNETFASRGEEMFATTEEDGFNCAFCHGQNGVGNSGVPYAITDAEGRFVAQVDWQGPALNTVLLRYSREEVRSILTYGRPFSPMPAWGAAGGGPLTDQQIQNLIDYLASIQLTPEQAQAEALEGLQEEKEAAAEAGDPYSSDGEALFNLGYYSGFAGGAYSCGRCHTTGWSYGEKEADGNGALGPPLWNGSTTIKFPGDIIGAEQQVQFVCEGSEEGEQYGRNGIGDGKMPGFCITPPQDLDPDSVEVGVEERDAGTPEQGAMLTEDQVRAIVEYERSL